MNSLRSATAQAVAKNYLSPLRYPGGKRKLVSYLATSLERVGVQQLDRILEPFAGGASVSIAFLEAGVAEEVVLNDLDPLVSAFWGVVFSDQYASLADRIYDTKVNLSNWQALKECDSRDKVDMAFKCIFLNRTSFSGSLHPFTGPLGGKAQTSENKIDCRWNAEALAERIWALAKHRDRVRVRNMDFRKFVGAYRSAHKRSQIGEVFWYFDPPFFKKAEKLYRHWFEEPDHKALYRCLAGLNDRWILSYDSCPESRKMYSDHPGKKLVDMRYTAANSSTIKKLETMELVVESLLRNASGAGYREPVAALDL